MPKPSSQGPTAKNPLVLLGDSLKLMTQWEGNKLFDLIFADPPYNIGQEYRGYTDRRADFEDWMHRWISAAWNLCDGVLCLHGNDALADIYLDVARQNRMRRVAWINWHYRFGQCSRHNWIDARQHCLVFSKHKTHTWNPEEVLVESDRVAMGDKRVGEMDRGGQRLPFTVWGVPSDGKYWGRVQGGNKERRNNHPNQLPEVYLERLIRAYTNPGDAVLDPFAGSGTTAVVGSALGRVCTTIDISPDTVRSVKERIQKGAVRVK